jgi:hypothetical protein
LKKNLLRNPRLFLFIGFGLIIYSLVLLPITVEVDVHSSATANNPAVFPDYETFGIGFLFAPVVAVWGLMGIAIGTLASSRSKTKTLLSIIPVGLICVGLAFTIWMVLRYGYVVFWWGYFCLFLVPSIVTIVVSVLYLLKKERLLNAFNNRKTVLVVSCFIVSVPLLFSVILWMALL